MPVQLIHNPKCSKSRQAKELLTAKGVAFEVREYLKTPLSKAELADLAKKLGVKPREMLRTKEDAYKARKLDRENVSDEQILSALAEEPVLLERPIVVKGNRAAIGRPTEKILDVL